MDKLILELIEIKYKKSICAINQKYEEAANLRHIEKSLEVKIYNIIKGNEIDHEIDYTTKAPWIFTKLYIETIRNYILENYGYDYPNIWSDIELGKGILRDLRLKIIGI
jgi:hypothetical protein